MNFRKYSIKIVFLLLIAVVVTGCGVKKTSEKQKIKIAYLPITHALPLFVQAKLQKENPKYQVELVKYGSWSELMDALNTGRVDGASVLIELAVKSKEQGIDLKAVALGHRDGNVIIVDKSIDSAEDLKEKTFAIPHRQSSHNILYHRMVEHYGIDPDELKIVELPPSEMPAALAQGQIAGYCVAEPFGAKSVENNTGKVLFDSSELWEDSLCCSMVFTNDFLEENEAVAKEFVKDYQQAGKYIHKNTAETKEIAKEYLSVEEEVLELSLKWISYEDLSISPEAYEQLTGFMNQYELSKNTPSYEEFIEGDLIEK